MINLGRICIYRGKSALYRGKKRFRIRRTWGWSFYNGKKYLTMFGLEFYYGKSMLSVVYSTRWHFRLKLPF